MQLTLLYASGQIQKIVFFSPTLLYVYVYMAPILNFRQIQGKKYLLRFIFSKDPTMINPLIHGSKKIHTYLKENCSLKLTAAGLLIPPCIKIKGLKQRRFVGIFRPPSLKQFKLPQFLIFQILHQNFGNNRLLSCLRLSPRGGNQQTQINRFK